MPLSPLNSAQPAPGPRLRSAVLLAAALAALGGCQALGGGGGVMPAGDVGPPPSLRGSVPGRVARADSDPDAPPAATAPTRRLDLPNTARGEARAQATAERRIRREDIEGEDTTSRSAAGGMAPSMTTGGNVGLGGRF